MFLHMYISDNLLKSKAGERRFQTRMHSSRIRTDRRLTVSQQRTDPRPPQKVNPPQKADPSSEGRPLPCEQTNACESITFPHTSYAVGEHFCTLSLHRDEVCGWDVVSTFTGAYLSPKIVLRESTNHNFIKTYVGDISNFKECPTQ